MAHGAIRCSFDLLFYGAENVMWAVVIDNVVGNKFKVFRANTVEKIRAIGAQVVVEYNEFGARPAYIFNKIIVGKWPAVTVAPDDPLHRSPQRNALATGIEGRHGKREYSSPAAATLQNALAHSPLDLQRFFNWLTVPPKS
jgi:hypothetical protein